MCKVYLVLVGFILFFVFKQKTAYDMRISDWSSDVCSSDLHGGIDPAIESIREIIGLNPVGHLDNLLVGEDRKSVVKGKSVSVRVDLGGRGIITKKTHTTYIIISCSCHTHNDHRVTLN